MSYDHKGGILNFFAPNIPVATTDAGIMKEIDIGAASATAGEFVCFRPCVMRKAAIAITGEAVSGTTTAPTVVFTKRVLPMSDSGSAAVCTITVPSGTAIGKVVQDTNFTPVNFAIGDTLKISWTVGVGTPTGMGVAYAEFDPNPEVAGNNTDVSESA